MADRKKCFISYAQVDEDFVNEFIIPALVESGVEVISQNISDFPVYFKKDFIVGLVLKSDFVVCLLNKRSTYVNLELGAAIGNNKPVLALLDNDNTNEAELGLVHYVRYNKDNPGDLSSSLRQAIQIVSENVIKKSATTLYYGEYLIGIKVGTENTDYERELEFTLEFIKLLKSFSEDGVISLLQTSKGSFESLFGLNFKPITDLLEKALFFPAEWKKKWAEAKKTEAEVDKVKAETDKTRADAEKSRAEVDKTYADAEKSKAEAGKTEAETEKLRAETKAIEQDTEIKRVEKILELMSKYKDLGVVAQFDNQLLITAKPDGTIEIKAPGQLE